MNIWILQLRRLIIGKPLVHCWDDSDDSNSTCMRALGHLGKHVYIPDSEIIVSFK